MTHIISDAALMVAKEAVAVVELVYRLSPELRRDLEDHIYWAAKIEVERAIHQAELEWRNMNPVQYHINRQSNN